MKWAFKTGEMKICSNESMGVCMEGEIRKEGSWK